MPLSLDLQQLNQDALIELFEISGFNPASPYDTLRFCNHAGVRFNGFDYLAVPCEADGFEYSGKGTLPRPKITVSNSGSFISGFVYQYGDLLGAKFVRRRTMKKYLDGQATADPSQQLPLDIYRVQQRTLKNKQVIEWELSAAIDLVDEELPRRPIVANTCMWVYRSSECSYAGGPVAKADGTPTIYDIEDSCGHRIPDCKLRFGANAPLPFGAFPNTGRIY
jgi:lambda family phage minor tail protein L